MLQLSHVDLDTMWLVASGFHQLLLEEFGQSPEDRLALRLFKVTFLKGS